MSTVAIELPYDIAKASPAVQARYAELVETGVTPRMAEMLALRAAPRVMTDSVLFAHYGNLDSQFAGAPCGALESLVAAAKKHGYTPGRNDFYDDNLAVEFGHPTGFVSPCGGRNQIRRTAEALDVDLHGPVEVRRQRRGETAEDVCRLAPDLVEETVNDMIRANPDLRTVDRRELRDEAVLKHGYDDSKLTGEGSKDVHYPSEQ